MGSKEVVVYTLAEQVIKILDKEDLNLVDCISVGQAAMVLGTIVRVAKLREIMRKILSHPELW